MTAYLTIPLSLPGDPEKGEKDKVVAGKILPASVMAYHEGFYWGTFLYLQTGQCFLTPLTVKEYEEKINEYWQELAKEQAKVRGKIQMINGRH